MKGWVGIRPCGLEIGGSGVVSYRERACIVHYSAVLRGICTTAIPTKLLSPRPTPPQTDVDGRDLKAVDWPRPAVVREQGPQDSVCGCYVGVTSYVPSHNNQPQTNHGKPHNVRSGPAVSHTPPRPAPLAYFVTVQDCTFAPLRHSSLVRPALCSQNRPPRPSSPPN